MRRRLTFLVPLLICLIAVGAHALNVKVGFAAKVKPNGALATFHWKAYKNDSERLPSGATIYTYDGSACYFKRVGVDSGFVKLPADNSILFPAGGRYTVGDSLVITVLVAGHADSVAALGWGE